MIILVIGFLMFFAVLTYGLFSLRDNLASNNLYDALSSSVYYARDNADRTDRGVFVVNKNKLNQHFNEEHIKSFGGQRLNSGDYTISYIPDRSAHSSLTTGDRIAIKAIRVNVNYKISSNYDGKMHDNVEKSANSGSAKDSHVATLIMHPSDKVPAKDAANHTVSSNDLSTNDYKD